VIAKPLSITEMLEDHLSTIHADEPAIQAWTTLAVDQARWRASELSVSGSDRPLYGLTFGIKDVIDVEGMPTNAGSPLLKGSIAASDAASVQSLRAAGAIILGKTATTEFAFYDPAPTRNPRNLAHTPGGSSSGSAAAVAAGFCTAAIGTQTFGSVIRPASYCGVFGVKPTYEAISRDGVIQHAWSLDHVGIFARCAGIAAKVADVLLGRKFVGERPALALYESPRTRKDRLRDVTVGIPDRYFSTNLDATVRRGYDSGIQALLDAHIRIREITLPASFENAIAAAGIILRAEAAAFHRRWYPERANEYSPQLRAIIDSGTRISAIEYLQARQVQRSARRQMLDLMKTIDFVVTPSTPTTAPKGLSWTGDPVFNTPFSVFGLPAMTLPASYSADGLPAGLQVAGRPWSETQLFRLALALEDDGFGRFIPPGSEETDSHGN
jgi:aspartyl-tRNA(Asn)/glutamyl-tRNA(Gln) amidotransferase subunit A